MLQRKVQEIPREKSASRICIYVPFLQINIFFHVSVQWAPCPFPHLPDNKNHYSRRNPGQNTFQEKVIDNFFVRTVFISCCFQKVSRSSKVVNYVRGMTVKMTEITTPIVLKKYN